MKMNFFNTIVATAMDRPVTAADFAPFVGAKNWLTVDSDNMPLSFWARNMDVGIRCDAVCEFTLRRVFTDNNGVEILVKIDDLVPDGTLMHLDADELAIRMEDS
jgi:hypothetical protein